MVVLAFLIPFFTLFLRGPLNQKIEYYGGENLFFIFLSIAMDFSMSSDTTEIE